MKRTIRFEITTEYDNMTVEQVLHKKLDMSSALITDLKKYSDGILFNSEHIRTIDRVSTGGVLEVNIYENVSENIIPNDIEIDVVYEDEDILIVNKPPCMPTHPSAGHYEGTLANAVMAHYKNNGEEHVFRAINRLDKDTSGIMCIAKNSYANARLCKQINDGTLKRRYRAVATGCILHDGTVDAPILRESFIKRCVHPDGQRAITHYKVIKNTPEYTLLELNLETGRTHQIRVHMAHIGHPLVGDWLYGGRDSKELNGQLLHSSYLEFIHPMTNEIMKFYSDIDLERERFV